MDKKLLVMDFDNLNIREKDPFYVCKKRTDGKWQILMSRPNAVIAGNFRKTIIQMDKSNKTFTDEMDYCICRQDEHPVEVIA